MDCIVPEDGGRKFFRDLGNYRHADKSLAQPGRKQATFPAFYGTLRFITTFTTILSVFFLFKMQFVS
jgi:hypothetical protein